MATDSHQEDYSNYTDYSTGDIVLFGLSYAPAGWIACEGQALNTADYQTLFSVIGYTYGEDGAGTFKLPDLRGALPASYMKYCICYKVNYPIFADDQQLNS